MQSLARQLEASTERLAAASVAGLYSDPFWFARYGEDRARRFGGEDAVFHVRYLVQALDTNDSGVMERYARWLQGLLVPRGMCSNHIAAHFQGLHEALVLDGLTQPPQALEFLRAACSALEWPEGPAHEVQQALPGLLAHVLQSMDPPDASPSDGAPSTLETEIRLQLSYLMDAMGTKRPGLFVDHVRWYSGFWPQRELRWGYRELLERLEVALIHQGAASKIPRATLAMGLTALEKELA